MSWWQPPEAPHWDDTEVSRKRPGLRHLPMHLIGCVRYRRQGRPHLRRPSSKLSVVFANKIMKEEWSAVGEQKKSCSLCLYHSSCVNGGQKSYDIFSSKKSFRGHGGNAPPAPCTGSGGSPVFAPGWLCSKWLRQTLRALEPSSIWPFFVLLAEKNVSPFIYMIYSQGSTNFVTATRKKKFLPEMER